MKGLKDTILFFKHSGNFCFFVNVTIDQCLLLLVLFFKKPQVLPRDRTQITKKYLNVWKTKFSLLNLQFRMTIMVVQEQLLESAVCLSDL